MEQQGPWARKPISRLESAAALADLRQRVLQTVREDIYTYRLRPGQRLDEVRVMARTGVSRGVVHQCLQDLSEEGWLTTAGKEPVVAAPSPEEAAEVDEVRRALEEVMIRRFVAMASDSQMRALRSALTEFERIAELPPDPGQLLRGRDNFYGVILRGGAVMATLDALVKLRARIILLMCASLCLSGRPAAAAAELRQIYEACAARDADRAVEACLHHLTQSYDAGFRALGATGFRCLGEESA